MILAYIDIALGSMLLQAVGGVVLAGLVMGRRMMFAPLKWLLPDDFKWFLERDDSNRDD